MQYTAITNNPQVEEAYKGQLEVEYFAQAKPMELLMQARDRVHLGWRLVSHPLAGSVKPGQTPYRSLLLERPGHGVEQTDPLSLMALEDSIKIMQNFADFKAEVWTDKILSDLRMVDLDLFHSAIQTLL